jgi:hypothetical protein
VLARQFRDRLRHHAHRYLNAAETAIKPRIAQTKIISGVVIVPSPTLTSNWAELASAQKVPSYDLQPPNKDLRC